ncbi:hypothetical protein BRC66_06710 [Halobacteriales archaeon QH_2_66_30]|nr:MAG: hypothetical protein BRC66_06710 [Halobacteriales archaeon QH_2_66_30]
MASAKQGETGKLSTGIDTIDRRLGGGLEPGSLLSIVAEPAMQSEALLHQLIGMRPTLYLTTLRGSAAVKADMGSALDGDVFVESVSTRETMDNELLKQMTGSGSYSPSFGGDDSPLDAVYEILSDIDRELNVVIDTTNPLEEAEDKHAYREVLNELKSTMLETDGLGILHCVTLGDAPPFRDVTLTISDVVWELDLVSANSELEYQLTIPKNRGGAPVLDETTIVIDQDVWIDESRAI